MGGRTNILKVLIELGGPSVLDDQNAEGLSVLGASKSGRHVETTKYIENVFAKQRETELSAWDASLADILQELEPPRKKKAKSSSKRKGKVTGTAVNQDLGTAAVDSTEGCSCPLQVVVAPEIPNSDTAPLDSGSANGLVSEQ